MAETHAPAASNDQPCTLERIEQHGIEATCLSDPINLS